MRTATRPHGRISALLGVATMLALVADPSQSSASAAPGAHKKPPAATDGTAGAATTGAVGDVIIDGWGDEDGYHLEVGRGASGYVWHEAAVLRPAGLDVQSWTGYQCVSGDGRYAAVAVEPTSVVNLETARDRGAFAYSVNLTSGKVRPVAAGVGLKYFSPGCGMGDSAVFTLNLGSNDAQTELVTVNLDSGKVSGSVKLLGQVTSTVPTATGPVGVVGSTLVAVKGSGASGHTSVIAKTSGDPYDLRPAADGGVSFLAAKPGSSSAAVVHERGGRLTVLGSGPLTRLALFQGRRGHAVLSGATSTNRSGVAATGLRVVNDSRLAHGAVASSLDGDALLGDPTGEQTDPLLLATRDNRLVKDKRAATTAIAVERGASYEPPGAASASPAPPSAGRLRPYGDAAPAKTKPKTTSQTSSAPKTGTAKSPGSSAPPRSAKPSTGGTTKLVTPTAPSTNLSRSAGRITPKTTPSGSATPDSASSSVLAAAPEQKPATGKRAKPAIAPPDDPNQDPTCAVAPLNEKHQVLQPSPAQVNWASQMIEQGLLTGSTYARPANFDNMGLASYSPSDDFPVIPLEHPSGSSQTTVPPAVYSAIMAQESNYDQASWHAPEGTAGDPLISDYYGADYDIVSIDYADADCGYGIGQVTDGMHVGDWELSAHGQIKVAVDYQENIAAGLQILETTWNQLYDDGIIANNGDPADLENWFFAAWAYNSGIQPTGAYDEGCTPGPDCTGPDGTWGMGWSNNPENPDYPPNRDPYLQDTYADAAHPADWSYEERVMGWMASPIIKDNSQAYDSPTYHGSNSWIQLPPFDEFCAMAQNDCNPTATNPDVGDAGHCMLDDYECWWHAPASWASNCATTCATSPYQYSSGSEPVDSNYNPFACNVDRSSVPSSAIIVDDEDSPYYNLMGCSSMNWSDDGSFDYAFGENSNGDPIGAIDTHQLGTGLGGHDIFTHTETGSNPSLINTGTWTPDLPSVQYYKIKLHIPYLGANATNVVYTINPGGSASPWKIRVNQAWEEDTWVTIGTFAMQNGGNVVLTNKSTVAGSGGESLVDFDVAFDAIAFIPEGGSPGTPIGGPPTVQDAPKGSNPAWVQCGCAQRTAGDPVNTATGYYGDTWTDLDTPGRGIPLDFTRTYTEATADPNGPNGSSAVNGPFGYGWTDSYNLTAATASGSGDVTITQEDSSQVAFTDSSGTYTPAAPRDDATLTKSGSDYIYTRRGSEIFIFDVASGHLLSEQDLPGKMATTSYQTTLAYNGSGQLSTITDPDGRAYTLTWSGGHISELEDSAGPIVTYTYDSSNNLTGVYGVGSTRSPSLEDNDLTSYGYNSDHLMTSIRTPDNQGGGSSVVTSMVYNSGEQVTSQTDAEGDTTTFTYGPSSSPVLDAGQTLVTDPSGHKTLDSYDDSGLLTSATVGYGTSASATTSYTYDPISLGISTMVDPDGDTTTYTYDDHGNRTSASDPDGYTTNYAYNDAGELTETIDGNGVATVNGYDQAGHIKTGSYSTNDGTFGYGDLTSTTVTQANNIVDSTTGNFGAAPTRTTNYYYDDPAHPGDQTRIVDADGQTTTMTYDTAGDLASTTDPNGNETLQGWDTSRGWLTHTVTPAGHAASTTTSCTPPATGCITYAHDAYGNATATTDPLGHTTHAAYDADGNKTSSTDADGNETTYSYDAADRITTTTRPDSTTLTTDYNADSTAHSTTDGAGNTTTYTYDGQGRQVTVTNPDSRTTTTGYDANGNVISVQQPGGQTTTTDYDADGRPTAIHYSDSTPDVTAISYDGDGNRLSMTDGTGTSTGSFDVFNELTEYVNGAGAVTDYTYDHDGDVTSLTYPDGTTVTNGYNDADQLTSVTDAADNETDFDYTADGLLSTTSYPNGTTVTNGYNDADQQTATTLKQGGTTLGTLIYGRDKSGQLYSQTPSGALPGSATTYTYTTLQQVKTSVVGTTTTNYGYDGDDNITTNGAATQNFDAANQLCWSTTSTVTGEPACTAPPTGATTYTYNSNGQRTGTTPSAGTTSSYTYNQTGELTATTTPAGSGSYTYDGTGLRASKTVSGTTTNYTWLSLSGSSELLTDGTTDYIYGPDNQPIEQTSSSTTAFYVSGQLGSTIALTSASGSISGTYTYNTYGKATAHTGTSSTPLKYGGGYTDAESGLIYLQARYYDPATGLFMTVDPAWAQTGQRYAYAADNPLSNVDPTGLCWSGFGWACKAASSTANFAKNNWVGVTKGVHAVAGVVTTVAGGCAVIAGLSVVGNLGLSEGCAAVAAGSAGVQVASGALLYATGHESSTDLGLDTASAATGGLGYGLTRTSAGLARLAESVDAAGESAGFFKAILYAGASGVVEGAGMATNILNNSISIPTILGGGYLTIKELIADCSGG